MVEKDWTLERVMAANEEYRKANPDAPSWSEPLYAWVALHDLDLEERRYQDGDQGALLAAVATCAHYDLVMPDWVATNFLKAYRRGIHFQVRSWDEVFGRPLKKGRHLANARKRWEERLAVYNRVREILATKQDTPIDEALFELVGSELGLSKTVATELYYETKKMFGELPTTMAGAVACALLAPYVVNADEDEPAGRG